MAFDEILNILQSNNYFKHRLVHIEQLPEHKAHYCQNPGFSPKIQNYLTQKNISLYLHQCKTIEAVRNGQNVIITTPTASGKTLAYNLPVLEKLETDGKATALYIFPTKALTNDQLKTLKEIQNITGINLNPAIYDGDIPSRAKSFVRNSSRIILTNPYELHQILPWHFQWTRFFSNLKFIIIDEAHHYRGVFGSNVAFVIRRLLRIAKFYGSNPQFILSSATLANPIEFAQNLTGKNFQLIDTDGAPKGQKIYVFYNPYYKPDIQTSIIEETARLLATMVFKNLKTIAFTQSRRLAELVAMRSRELLEKKYPELAKKIASYRAGYLPSDRRRIEQQLKNGQITGIASTNALELGIDIGHLDAVIITGFPGTIISFMQQSGRAGRKAKPALTIFVAYQDKLDQYFMHNPRELFDKGFEHAIIDLKNPYIYSGHLLCAAAEMPLTSTDKLFFDEQLFEPAIQQLENQGLLKQTPRGWIYTGKIAPNQVVSLSSISSDTYKVIHNGQIIETLSQQQAFREAHHGAVFLHQGETYIVTGFDLNTKTITVERKSVDFYTQPLKSVNAWIQETYQTMQFDTFKLHYGKLQISEQFTGYKVKRGDQIIGYGELDLPPLEFETTGIWFTFDENLLDKVWQAHPTKKTAYPSLLTQISLYRPELDLFAGGLHGVEHAMIGIMPFLVMADRWDLGGFSTINHSDTGLPTIFIYDGYPGGIGLTQKAYYMFDKIVRMTHKVVSQCKCKDGCPACIMSPKCGNDNRPLDKQAAIYILEIMLKSFKTSEI